MKTAITVLAAALCAAPLAAAPLMMLAAPDYVPKGHPGTGKTETVFARAVPAGPDPYLAHMTYRYMPMPKEAQGARSFLGAMKIG